MLKTFTKIDKTKYKKASICKKASALGTCLQRALQACEENPKLKLMMGPPGQSGDTAHFWTVKQDGTVYDPTPEAVSEGYLYQGREVDVESVKEELGITKKQNKFASVADWFPKETRDLLDSWLEEIITAFIGIGQALLAPLNFNKTVEEVFAKKKEVGYVVIDEPLIIRVLVTNETFEEYPLDQIEGSVTKWPGAKAQIEIGMPLQLLEQVSRQEIPLASLQREVQSILYHEYAHLQDPKRNVKAPWNNIIDSKDDLKNIDLYKKYLESPKEQDARLGELIPRLVKLIENNLEVGYSELFQKALPIFRTQTRGLPWGDNRAYNKRLRRFEKVFRSLYEDFHSKEKAYLKSFVKKSRKTKRAYQVESPSPLYTERLQPRIESLEMGSSSYDPPMSLQEIEAKGFNHLLNDPIHKWRAETGIELIHKEPSLGELERIWSNWQLMSEEQKVLSDKKSQQLFGLTNEEHYKKLKKEVYKTTSILRGFTVEAAPWTDKELKVLKTVYKEARDRGIPHNKIYDQLSRHIPHSMRGIKQKLESLYRYDDELKSYKFEHWDRDKIIEEIKKLYVNGELIARKSLPSKLEYQIANHSLPKAITRGFEVYFDSFDHAIAEAILQVGYARTQDGELDQTRPLDDLKEAWRYYRRYEKQNNIWTKEEIIYLFQRAHDLGFPLTKSFFTSHPDVYKSLLEVSRGLDGLRKSVDRLGLTWGDLVIEAVPDYEAWYNEAGRPLNSMGELRVIRFLDLNGIPYRATSRMDKIPITEPEILEAGYRNFVPDIFILNENGEEIGLVEIYGAIADSGAASGELSQKYREKIDAKEKVYNNLPIKYVAIHDNELYGCDLSDERLREKFNIFMNSESTRID